MHESERAPTLGDGISCLGIYKITSGFWVFGNFIVFVFQSYLFIYYIYNNILNTIILWFSQKLRRIQHDFNAYNNVNSVIIRVSLAAIK